MFSVVPCKAFSMFTFTKNRRIFETSLTFEKSSFPQTNRLAIKRVTFKSLMFQLVNAPKMVSPREQIPSVVWSLIRLVHSYGLETIRYKLYITLYYLGLNDAKYRFLELILPKLQDDLSFAEFDVTIENQTNKFYLFPSSFCP